jgi:hypothetical protein
VQSGCDGSGPRPTSYVGIVAPALNEVVIERLAARGFAGVKVSHGYVVLRLLAALVALLDLKTPVEQRAVPAPRV